MLSIGSLIGEFSTLERVPVDVNNVLQALRNRGVTDEIYFWSADINSEHLRGLMVRTSPWDYPQREDGPTQFCTDIYTSNGLPTDWKRLVECKELLHILDSDGAKANTEEGIARLCAEIVLPPELQDANKDAHATITDRIAIMQAVAILFPLASRNLFVEPLRAGKMTLDDIARIVDIPRRFVGFIMSDKWLDLHAILLKT